MTNKSNHVTLPTQPKQQEVAMRIYLNLRAGDLVIINESFSQKQIGKLAMVMKSDFYNAEIKILHTGEREHFATYKLTKLEDYHERKSN